MARSNLPQSTPSRAKPSRATKPPQPLTQCAPPSLDWSRPKTPVARDFGDVYFSPDGGIEETRTVYLGGCGLPEAWQSEEGQTQIRQKDQIGGNVYTIAELGFGSGLNFLAAWQMWEETAPKTARLHFISIEKYPFSAAELQQSLSVWPALALYAAQLIAAWPQRVKGIHRLHFGRVTLTLVHDDVKAALDALDVKANAWFLDGFNPEKNPDMWSAEVMQKVAELSAPKARLATFTVASSVRKALSEAGFKVERKAGFGRKRNRLEAQLDTPLITSSTPPARPAPLCQNPIIIGSGIGGASLARAFLRRGIMPRIISRGNVQAASGNVAALIKPRLDLQDRTESRFFLASYLYALNAYSETGGIISRGVTQFPKTDKDALRFEKLAKQAGLPPEHLGFENGALSLPLSLTISPKTVLAQWTQGAEVETRNITDLDAIDSPVFAAIGYGIKPLLQDGPELRYSRGQLSWAQTDNRISDTLSYGGYALPVDGKLLLGATHDRLSGGDPYAVCAEDDLRNFAQFENIMGYTLKPSISRNAHSRASVRVTTPNTLPMILRPKPDQFILSGLGSRGFVFAPLLAEAIVCRWLGEPMPIDKKLWAQLGPR